MHVDRYAAPRAHVVSPEPSLPPLLEPSPWSIGDVYGEAWRRFRPHALTLVLGLVLANAIPQLVGVLVGFVVGFSGLWLGSVAVSTLEVAGQIGVALLNVFFQLGALRFVLGVVHGEAPRVGAIFTARGYLAFLGQFVLVTLASALGLLALVLPGVVVIFAFTFAGYFVVDRRLGALAAMSASWQATRGQRMKLVGFAVASLLFSVSGVLLLGVGVFVTWSLSTLAWAVIYARISGSRVPEPIDATTPELAPALPVVAA